MGQENKVLSTSVSDIRSNEVNIHYSDFLFGLISLFLYTYAVMNYGQGITDDSVNFLSAAFSAPQKLIKIDGSAFLEWPPLYPLLLSVFKLTPFSPLTFSTVLHGVVIFANSWLFSRHLRKLLKVNFISIVGRASFAISTPILLIHVFIWSEAVFILLFQIALIFYKRFLLSKKSYNLLFLILCSAAMCLQRKSGIIINLAFTIAIIASLKPASISRKITTAISYFILASVPFMFYFLRRKVETGTYFSKFKFEPSLFMDNVSQSFNIITSWILPDEFPLGIRISCIVIIIVSFIVINFTSTRKIGFKFHKNILILLSVLGTYTFVIIVGFVFVGNGQELDDRIFSPIIIPGTILFFVMIEEIYRKLPLSSLPNINFLRKTMAVLLIIWLAYPIVRTIHNLNIWHSIGGGGYNMPVWRNNDLIQHLTKSPPKIPFKTDNEFAAFYFLNIKPNNKSRLLIPKDQKVKNYLYICFNKCDNPPKSTIDKFNGGMIYKISE